MEKWERPSWWRWQWFCPSKMMSFLYKVEEDWRTRNDGVFSRPDRRRGVTVAGIEVESVFFIICRISLGTDKWNRDTAFCVWHKLMMPFTFLCYSSHTHIMPKRKSKLEWTQLHFPFLCCTFCHYSFLLCLSVSTCKGEKGIEGDIRKNRDQFLVHKGYKEKSSFLSSHHPFLQSFHIASR